MISSDDLVIPEKLDSEPADGAVHHVHVLELVLEVMPAELVIDDAVHHGHVPEPEVRELVCQM